jgi:hypothetical protein
MNEFVEAYYKLVTPEAIKTLSSNVHKQYTDMKRLYPKDVADIGEEFVKKKIAQKQWSDYIGDKYADNFSVNNLWHTLYDYYNKNY